MFIFMGAGVDMRLAPTEGMRKSTDSTYLNKQEAVILTDSGILRKKAFGTVQTPGRRLFCADDFCYAPNPME